MQAQVIHETIVPKEPPPEFEFMADPPSISAFDLDVVKLTAQFVARNGRQFLTQLMQKEQRNYQFDFLRPQHSLFNYFTKLVEQYTKVCECVCENTKITKVCVYTSGLSTYRLKYKGLCTPPLNLQLGSRAQEGFHDHARNCKVLHSCSDHV